MKYQVTTYVDEKKYETQLSIRSDASLKTVYLKCINSIVGELKRSGVVKGAVRYGIDYPNIWRNGAFASIWLVDPFADIRINRDGKPFV